MTKLKRKAQVETESGSDSEASSVEAPKVEKSPKKVKEKKQKTSTTEEKNGSEEKHVSAKDENGRWPLGNNKFASIGEYKGVRYVDIREFYSAPDGELKPGKKGVTLNTAQWPEFLKHIDELTADLKK